MYGVIVCSKCKRAKGVSLDQKTTTCQCGNKIILKESSIGARTEDARELARAVAAENARLRGDLEEYRRTTGIPRKIGGIHGRVADKASKAGKKDDMIKAVALQLTKSLGSFTAKDFVLVLTSMGIAHPNDRLKKLVELNIVYEPEPGRFKAV